MKANSQIPGGYSTKAAKLLTALFSRTEKGNTGHIVLLNVLKNIQSDSLSLKNENRPPNEI